MIANIQSAAARLAAGPGNENCAESVERLNLPTLDVRRKRGDRIIPCICVGGKEKININDYATFGKLDLVLLKCK